MNNTEMFGEIISPDLLGIKKSKRLIQYIDSLDNSYLKVVEIRQKYDRQFETVIVDLGVERPQKIINDIKRIERLALVFHSDDIHQPEVLALREDFPVVSHLNLQLHEYPKSLCLYEQPYEVIKLTWTPSGFIKQIQNWLNKTVIGTPHEEGQAKDLPVCPSLKGWRQPSFLVGLSAAANMRLNRAGIITKKCSLSQSSIPYGSSASLLRSRRGRGFLPDIHAV
jgi:hypothetical protein